MDKVRLKQYGAIKRELNSIREQLEEVGAELYAPKKVSVTGLPGGVSNRQRYKCIGAKILFGLEE